MKKLTAKEFHDRLQAINRAMNIFSHMTDNDVTRAFTAYQEILAETDRQIMVTTTQVSAMTGSKFDDLVRPLCPECGYEMNFRQVPPNPENVKSQLVCSNVNCDTVLDSEKTVTEWLRLLPKKEGS
jgi:hypothetical protein